MRSWSTQAANGTMTTEDVSNINDEVQELLKEINRIATTTEFTTKKLLDCLQGRSKLILQVGANPNQIVDFTIESMADSSEREPGHRKR